MLSSRLVRRFSPGFLGLLGTALVIYVVVAAMQRSAHIDPHGYLIGNPAPPLPWLDPPIAFLVAATLGIVGTTLAARQVYRRTRTSRPVAPGVAWRHTRGPAALDLASLWLCTGVLVCCMALGFFSIGPFLAPVTLVAVVAAGIASRPRRYRVATP